jgi:hypothetical protein
MNTADQARQLWCPMVRIGVTPSAGGPCAINDPTINKDFSGRCVADKCAMWRWQDPAHESRKPTAWWPEDDDAVVEPPRPADLPLDAEWIPTTGEGEEITGGYWLEPQSAVDTEHSQAIAKRRGYCGLAGRPELLK